MKKIEANHGSRRRRGAGKGIIAVQERLRAHRQRGGEDSLSALGVVFYARVPRRSESLLA